MAPIFKKTILGLIFNSTLFFVLMIGIQNSSNKSKINFLVNETVRLPIGFIIGSSFIGGSAIASLLNLNLTNND